MENQSLPRSGYFQALTTGGLVLGAFLLTALVAHANDTGGREQEVPVSKHLEQIELRSIVSLPGELMFSLHDPEADRTFWIQTGETRNEIQAVEFDDETNLLTLRHGEVERQIGLTTRRSNHGSTEEVADTSDEDERRTEWRERREERRAEWREFREKWEAAAEDSPELREISEHFNELRGEMRDLRRAMRDADRDSEQFQELRSRGRELREELGLLHEYASETISEHPDFDEGDADRVRNMFGRGGRRGGGPGN